MPRFRESVQAEVATVISDFPTISNSEIHRYLIWKGFNPTAATVSQYASSTRTALNKNLRGKPRRKHVTPDGKRIVRRFRKKSN